MSNRIAAPDGFDFAAEDASTLCQRCGACCAYSAEWPRFSLESEEALALIPLALIDDSRGRMRCDGQRCSALQGEIGKSTACSIYTVRPDVCRTCQPGDPECLIARRHYHLPV
jgi:uncharacterized protein